MGTWPYRLLARERLLLTRQAKNDYRNIRPLWLFTFDVARSPLDEVFLQSPKHTRSYLSPIAAFLYVEPESEDEVVAPGVDHKRTLTVKVSRAETYRLAEAVVKAGLAWDQPLYKPRAQDIFQWRNDLYELQDTVQPDEFWGTTGVELKFKAPATKYRLDSNAPNSPVVIQLEQPPLPTPLDFYKARGDGEEGTITTLRADWQAEI